MLVEHNMKAGQTFVNILGGMGFAMVVVPKCAQRFANVAVGGVCRAGEAGAFHVVVIVVVLTRKEKPALCFRVFGQGTQSRIARPAITVRCRVEIVRMHRNRVFAKAAAGRARGQVVETAHQNRSVGPRLVTAHDGWHRRHRLISAKVGPAQIGTPEIDLLCQLRMN